MLRYILQQNNREIKNKTSPGCQQNQSSGKDATLKIKEEKIMVVQHNMTAANTNRQLGIITDAQAKSSEKLASGYKINRAADDAAGLSISEKMRSTIRGLDKASTNAQDGISLVQTAEGALNETHSILQRMNELATQAANDTNTSVDRTAIQAEIDQLTSEIDRIQSTTQFNTQNLLTGEFSSKKLQVGSLCGQSIEISISQMDSTHLSVSSLKVSSFTDAGAAMSKVQKAIDTVSTQRSALGAIQNRLEHTIANLDTTSENTSSAESRIRDTDMASEMVTYSKNNILAQAGQSMLAQANQSNQGVLSLLG
jgi:flagellin